MTTSEAVLIAATLMVLCSYAAASKDVSRFGRAVYVVWTIYWASVLFMGRIWHP